MDKRWNQLGQILVNYSVGVQPGERVMIAMSEVETLPLAKAVYQAVIEVGAFPQVQFLSETLRRILMEKGNQAQIDWVPDIEAYGMEWADVYFGLRGGYNFHEHAAIPDGKLARNQAAMGKISSMRWEKTRWVISRVPNEAFAQQADTNLDRLLDMYFDACLIDWSSLTKRWQKIADLLNKGEKIRLFGEGTDLSFSVKGRKWIVADGRVNMPDGEIMTSPVCDSVDGHISFGFPGVLGGRLMNNIYLEWKQGKLIKATSTTNQDYLHQILNTDGGSKRVGEFAFGTNPHIDFFCKDIFFDEKIAGTIHIALGKAYPECGGKNKSAIHWDIVKDFRQVGEVYLDGDRIFGGGKFLM